MKTILQWILDNWQLVVSVLLFVLSFILQILKKKNISSIESEIFYYCLKSVCLVESSDKKGKDKLDLAVQYVSKELNRRYPDLDTGPYFNFIAKTIEAILSTPHKHEKL